MTDTTTQNMSDVELGQALRTCYIEIAEQFIDDNEREVLENGSDEATVLSAWESETGQKYDSATPDTAWIIGKKPIGVTFDKDAVIVRLALDFEMAETLIRQGDLGDLTVGRHVVWKFSRYCNVQVDPWGEDMPTESFDLDRMNESTEGGDEELI